MCICKQWSKQKKFRSIMTIAATIAALSISLTGCGSAVQEMSDIVPETESVEVQKASEEVAKEAEANMYYEAGRASLYGLNGTEASLETACQNFLQAKELGKTDANFYLGVLYAEYCYPKKDYETAKKYFEACDNNLYAQIYLSIMYYFGQGVDEDKEKARTMIQTVIDQGCIDGYIAYACFEEDADKAYDYANKALNGNEQVYISNAMELIGNMCYSGKGTEQSLEKATEWFEKSANMGNAVAMKDLGVAYYYGHGVEQSYDKALQWFEKASDFGNANATHTMGYMYDVGQGVEQNYDKALVYYEKAADLGDASSMNNIGYMYHNGRGVEQSYEKAMDWYNKAAGLGNANAMNSLGYMYCYGQGVEQNFDKALEWYEKALGNGYTDAQKSIDEIKKQMK